MRVGGPTSPWLSLCSLTNDQPQWNLTTVRGPVISAAALGLTVRPGAACLCGGAYACVGASLSQVVSAGDDALALRTEGMGTIHLTGHFVLEQSGRIDEQPLLPYPALRLAAFMGSGGKRAAMM